MTEHSGGNRQRWSGLAGLLVAVLALAATGAGLWRLESATADLEVERIKVGEIPVSVYRLAKGEPAPVVLVAHGFAGSQALMQPYAVTLARNGYVAVTFDFPGHGRNPEPFVARIEDQERRIGVLMGALESVAGRAVGLPGVDGRMALLGHSMAGDVLVRFAAAQPDRASAMVLVSPYLAEDAPTEEPRNLLIVFGALEPAMLHQTGLKAISAATGSEAETGVLYGGFGDGSARRMVLAEGVEHIGVLYGGSGLAAALEWLDLAFDRTGSGFVDVRGPALGVLFLGLLALAWPLSRLLPRAATAPMGAGLGWRRLVPAAVAPALLTPVILRFLPTDYLPILLGGYLALHFGIYGLLTAVGTWLVARARPGQSGGRLVWPGFPAAAIAACAYVILAIAVPMDRYVTAYLPESHRLGLLLAMVPGTWAYFAADGWMTRGAGSPSLAPVVTKALFLLSLLLAVALNLRELFFLIILVPAILVFFLFFGLLGHWVYQRTGHPLVGALANGLAFAWAIAVTFPLVEV